MPRHSIRSLIFYHDKIPFFWSTSYCSVSYQGVEKWRLAGSSDKFMEAPKYLVQPYSRSVCSFISLCFTPNAFVIPWFASLEGFIALKTVKTCWPSIIFKRKGKFHPNICRPFMKLLKKSCLFIECNVIIHELWSCTYSFTAGRGPNKTARL